MDNQKDFYIKSKLKEDELISKKADDIFNSFFNEVKNMENEKVENVDKTTVEEKVVNINEFNTEDKKAKKYDIRRILSIAATFVVIFLGANVYASTQGYNNIFFLIKNLVTNDSQTITNKDDLLSDRDITISYQPIEIIEGLTVQINRLTVKDNKAVLYLDVDNKATSNQINTIAVYDTTNEEKLISNHLMSLKKDHHTEEIQLSEFSNDTKSLKLNFHDKDFNEVCSLEIILDKKEINILSSSEEEQIEKISEIELKEFLSKVVRIHFFGDKNAVTDYHTVQEYKDEIKVLCALEFLDKEKATFEEVHKVIKELTGEEITDALSLANVIVTKDKEGYKYIAPNKEHNAKALCLDINNMKYSDGIYTVNCIYTYPTDSDYKNNRIEELDKFTTTIDFKLNKDYKYTQYCIVGVNEFISNPYEVNNDSENENTDISEKEENIKNDNSTNNDNKKEPVKEEINNKNDNQTTDSNNNSNSEVVPEQPSTNGTANENASSAGTSNTQKIDNYASTMAWDTLWTPGIKLKVPAEWDVEIVDNIYNGNEEYFAVAAVVKGVATGINKETGEIINSNMTITVHMPEMMNRPVSLERYAKRVANLNYGTDTGTGYSKPGLDLQWRMVRKEDNSTTDTTEYYCHVESNENGTKSIGYVIEITVDNPVNFKVTNILNWIFGDIQLTSF